MFPSMNSRASLEALRLQRTVRSASILGLTAMVFISGASLIAVSATNETASMPHGDESLAATQQSDEQLDLERDLPSLPKAASDAGSNPLEDELDHADAASENVSSENRSPASEANKKNSSEADSGNNESENPNNRAANDGENSEEASPEGESGFRNPRAVQAQVCADNSILWLNRKGEIRRITTGTSNPGGGTLLTTVPPLNKGVAAHRDANGLAVTQDGGLFYALQQSPRPRGGGPFHYAIYKYDVQRNTWEQASNTLKWDHGNTGAIVAGAVQLSTGDYYFGSFAADESDDVYFHIYKLLPNRTVQYVGNFYTDRRRRDETNGDLAFDAKGNLFVIAGYHEGIAGGAGRQQKAQVYEISAEDLAQASGGTLRATFFKPINYHDRISGIAFSSRGTVFLGAPGGTLTENDPVRFEAISGGFGLNNLSDHSDLASCTAPTTIHLALYITPQAFEQNARNSFLLDVSAGNPADRRSIITVETTGRQAGYQDEKTGVFPMPKGTPVRISARLKNAASGEEDRRFSAQWVCYEFSENTGPSGRERLRGTGLIGDFTMPNDMKDLLSCLISVDAKNVPGSVEWRKIGDDTTQALSGSEWTLHKQGSTDAPIVIRDCEKSSEQQCRAAGLRDIAPARGVFKVDALETKNNTGTSPVTYVLTETKAPSGYEFDATRPLTKSFSLSRQSPTLNLGDLINKRERKGAISFTIRPLRSDRTPDNLAIMRHSRLFTATLEETGQQTAFIEGSNGDRLQTKSDTTAFDRTDRFSVRLPQDGVAGKTVSVVFSVDPHEHYADDAEIACIDTAASNRKLRATPLGIRNGKATWKLHEIRHAMDVECQLTEVLIDPSLTWRKVDELGNLLSGAEFRVSYAGRTRGQTVTRNITDCIAPNLQGCAQLEDKNPKAGEFLLKGLNGEANNFSLVETRAPLGYAINSTAITIPSQGHAKVHSAGDIVNTAINTPTLPLTGGMGSDQFFIGSGLALVLAFTIDRGRRIWKKRHKLAPL